MDDLELFQHIGLFHISFRLIRADYVNRKGKRK